MQKQWKRPNSVSDVHDGEDDHWIRLAEKIGVSAKNINDIEGKRRWPRESTLVKIAEALSIEVYQLFIPENLKSDIKMEENDENKRIRATIQTHLINEIRKSMNKLLDKCEKTYKNLILQIASFRVRDCKGGEAVPERSVGMKQ